MALVFPVATAGPTLAAPLYAITGLGTLGGDFTAAYGINNSGEVTGLSTVANGDSHAFITGPNGIGMTDLGGFKGLAINQIGQVIFGDNGGTIYVTGPNGVSASPLGGTSPNSLGFQGSFGFGFGTVNASGQIAGTKDSQGNILMDGPSIHGGTNNGPVGSHAFVTGPNGFGLTDLGTLGGSNSFARGINDEGQVVGGSNLAGTVWQGLDGLDAPLTVRRATLWSDGSIFDLTTLLDPNDPFVLSTASFTLDTAVGINDEGQIVADGFGYFDNGAFFNQAFLLTPESVPEPTSLALFGTALAALVAVRRRKRKRKVA